MSDPSSKTLCFCQVSQQIDDLQRSLEALWQSMNAKERKDAVNLRKKKAAFGMGRNITLLSTRELGVLKMLAQGYGNKAIASRIALSVKTIKTYKKRGYEKLRVQGPVEFMTVAIDNGWLLSSIDERPED